MALFTIECISCQAKLKVRRRAAIGAVLQCPRCGSMVHVVPPEGWHDDEAEPASEAPGEKSSTNEAEQTASQTPSDSDSPTTASVKESVHGHTPLEETADGPVWEAPQERSWRNRLRLTMLAIVVAGGSLALMDWMWRREPDNAARLAEPAAENTGNEPASRDDGEEPPANPTTDGSTGSTNGNEVEQTTSSPVPEAVAESDPISENASHSPTEETPTNLEAGSTGEGTAAPEAGEDAPTEPESGEDSVTNEEPEVEIVHLEPVDVAARLDTPLLGLRAADLPWTQVIQDLERIAHVGMGYSADAAWQGDSREEVSLDLSDKSIGQVLQTILAPRGLSFEITDYCVNLFVPECRDETVRTVMHPIPPEVSAYWDDETLSDVLRALLPEFAEAAPTSGPRFMLDSSHLDVTHHAAGHCQVRQLMRDLARCLVSSPEDSPHPPEIDQRTSDERRITLNFPRPTPLPTVFEEFSRATGLTVMVDWNSLAMAGIRYDASVTARGNDVLPQEWLDRLCARWNGCHVRIDANTVWITTREGAANWRVFQCYPLSDLPSARAQPRAIMEELTRRLGEEASLSRGWWHDAEGQRLLVMQSPLVQQQLRQLLDEWQRIE